MASLFKQPKSRFWWISYRDPATGRITRKSTKLTNFLHARKYRDEIAAQASQLDALNPKEQWDSWVLTWIQDRYPHKDPVLMRWRSLKMFLDEHHLVAPRQVTRPHANLYLEWRKHPNKSDGKFPACRNTALKELGYGRTILDEAVERGYIAKNPWRNLNQFRDPVRQKPELARTAMAKILLAIRREPEPRRTFLLHSFLIARYHGCRLNETWFNPQTQIQQLDSKPTVSFQTKGDRTHTVYLHPKLVRRFRHLIAAGKTETYARPASASAVWFFFLRRAGIKREYPGACFHSLRAMDYIGHASTTVHRTYVRLKADDLSVCADALS